MRIGSAFAAMAGMLALGACAAAQRPIGKDAAPLALELSVRPDTHVRVTYRPAEPARALHFAQELGGYRRAAWHPVYPDFFRPLWACPSHCLTGSGC